jgi:hypothetical protein
MDLTYVKDEGVNLNSLTITLISIVTYSYFFNIIIMSTSCWLLFWSCYVNNMLVCYQQG